MTAGLTDAHDRRRPIRLVVEIDQADDPVQGRICPAKGAPHAFVGWLQLIQVLDLAVAGSRRTSTRQETSHE